MIPKNAVIPEKPGNMEKEAGENWYLCPRCRTKLFKLRPFAKADGLEIKCRKCKKIINVSL